MKFWVILTKAGVVNMQVQSDVHPSMDPARTWDASWTAYEVPRFGDPARERYVVGTGWVTDMNLLRARLLDQIDDRRETEQMKYMTAGGAKKVVYRQKDTEVKDYRGLTLQAVTSLLSNLLAARIRFPAAYAQMDVTGETLDAVIKQFEAGANNSNPKVYKLDALAQKAKLAVKAATTEAAAVAAANVNWTV